MDRRARLRAFAAAIVVATALFGLQAVAADATPELDTTGNDTVAPGDRPPENATLVGVQSYGGFGNDNGKALVIHRGEVIWEFAPEDSRVFDVEYLGDGRIMASIATRHPPEDCPEEYTDPAYDGSHCVENRVVEIDYGTKEILWEYSWYDHFIDWHEVHDADRLENGQTAIIDMGNDRAFTVNRDEEITWQWNATEHLTEGTEFHDEYGGPSRNGPEADWTHMNDIDRLDNGNFQLSIRNYDVLVEVDPDTDDIVGVVGEPRERESNDPVLHEQHNPHRLEDEGTVLVADSEADQVIEVDTETDEVVWRFTGDRQSLRWPRDADRLSDGRTLITDSLRFRVLEVDRQGDVVAEYRIQDGDQFGIPYEADRIGTPEEADGNVSGRELRSRTSASTSELDTFQAYLDFYLPAWAGLTTRAALLIGALGSLGVTVDLLAAGVSRLVRRVRSA